MQRIILAITFVLSPVFPSQEDIVWFKGSKGVPIDQQYARLGTFEILLHCPVPESNSTVGWKMSSPLHGILKAVRRDGSLVLKNASLAQNGEYSCYDLTTGRLLRRIHLKLGYPPDKPLARCQTNNFSAINCSWRLETETHLPTFFSSTFLVDGEIKECVQATTAANSCFFDNVQMFSWRPYVLNVTAVNPLGTATTYYYFHQLDIIKPDPPEDLKVTQILGQRKKILLVWKPPSSWKLSEYFALKYMIRYTRDGSNTSKVTRPTLQTSFVLAGIRPGVTYHAQVAAKDFLDSGEYSDWSPAASGASWMPE
ncbi:interleukin-27 subunit beta [Zootoca vivipara]|uniref:interleukin-27 subunit beta n=1 Tax=Zootoca vivipara TaxID=8524 RepID=UPI001591000D|nr:interleukin-27 subunit beta [Zootoca vivipara]